MYFTRLKEFITEKFTVLTTFILKRLVYIVLLIVSAFIIWFFYTKTDVDKINVNEKRFIIYTFLLILIVIAFSTLRIYNAIVANSSYLHRLLTQLKLFATQLKNYNRDNKTNATQQVSASNNVVNAMRKLATAITRLFNQ
jgi:hypothetical protein